MIERYVEERRDGAMGDIGRISPALERQGYSWVVVRADDTMRGIALKRDIDVGDIVMLNTHIINPDYLYVGDRIYIPK